jgi:rubrerythrin
MKFSIMNNLARYIVINQNSRRFLMSIKGTQTEKNLLLSFMGESQARNKYTYFAKKAKDEGYVKISQIFEETATQESVHAKSFFKYLEGGDVEVTCAFPAGVIGTTLENLKAAAAGEHHEHTSMYPEFAAIAEKEGFSRIAHLWKSVAVAEKHHEARYQDFIKDLEAGTLFKQEEKVGWRCLKCGYVHEGTSAPNKCPACSHEQGWFEKM